MSIYFDITDVVDFAKRSTRLTGIQRVQLNIINLLAQRHAGLDLHCVFHDGGRDGYFEYDPRTRTHDVEFNAEHLLIDLGILKPSWLFPSTVQIKGYLGRGQSSKLMRVVKKIDVYTSALLWPSRLQRLGMTVVKPRPNAPPPVVRRIRDLPKDACLVNLGAAWAYPQIWEFARHHRARGGHVLQLIHDLIPMTHPQYAPSREPGIFQTWLDAAMEYATWITCNSKFTATEFLKYARAQGKSMKVDVTPLAHEFTGYARNAVVPPPAALRFLLGKRFVLTVGNIELRKNGLGLLRAWKQLIGELQEQTPLLIFAGRWGRIGGADVRSLIESDPELLRFVRVIESPSDEALAWLYRNCAFSAYPSFIEGWGLPVGESAWFGRVCLASNVSSVPEVCGNLAVYVDPAKDEEIMAAAKSLLVNHVELTARESNLCAAQLRTWADVAEDLHLLIKRRARLARSPSPDYPWIFTPNVGSLRSTDYV